MEIPSREIAHKGVRTLLGKAELPPKKRTLDRGKAVCNEPPKRERPHRDSNSFEFPKITIGVAEKTQNIDSQDQPKAFTDNEPQKTAPKQENTNENVEHEPSFNTYLNHNEESKGQLSTPPSQRLIVCKFCGKHFPTTQALGGHQNAHRKERETQKAMKSKHEFGENPFMYTFPGILSQPFRRSYIGNRVRYHPYNGYAQRPLQAMPHYSHPRISLARGPTGIGRTLEEFVGTSLIKPVGTSFVSGLPTPFASSLGPRRRSNGPTNFNPVTGSNLTAFLQARKNKNQHIERTGSAKMGSLPNHNESSKLESPMKQNESTKLDLNLKL